jgi:hypothetical protein
LADLRVQAQVSDQLAAGQEPVGVPDRGDERRRAHGCLLIVGIDHAEFGLILRVIDHALSTRAGQAAWIDYTAWGVRSAPT